MHAILPTCHYTVRVGDVDDDVPLDTFSKATKRVVGWNGEWLGGGSLGLRSGVRS